MMNTFIKGQCQNMVRSIEIFKSACELAAKRDDGKISKDEEKTLKMINKASDAFTKEIEKILKNT